MPNIDIARLYCYKPVKSNKSVCFVIAVEDGYMQNVLDCLTMISMF